MWDRLIYTCTKLANFYDFSDVGLRYLYMCEMPTFRHRISGVAWPMTVFLVDLERAHEGL